MAQMDILPDGVLVNILAQLGPKQLAQASAVCRKWRALASLDRAANLNWRSFYASRWKVCECIQEVAAVWLSSMS